MQSTLQHKTMLHNIRKLLIERLQFMEYYKSAHTSLYHGHLLMHNSIGANKTAHVSRCRVGGLLHGCSINLELSNVRIQCRPKTK